MLPTSIDWRPDEKRLRAFGWIAGAFFGALSWAAAEGRLPFVGWTRAPGVVLALAAVAACSVLFSLALPRANRPLYVGLLLITCPIGLVTSYLALALLFYGVILPVGLLMRLLGKDPLDPPREAPSSYFRSARTNRPKESYFRQY